jgi:hypothetical protein
LLAHTVVLSFLTDGLPLNGKVRELDLLELLERQSLDDDDEALHP